jgi:MoxR-like ATPase
VSTGYPTSASAPTAPAGFKIPAGAPGGAARAIVDSVSRAVLDRRETVELAVVAALAGGHILLEDLPGTGKTTLAKALSQTLGGDLRRVQATADLLPADITGSNIWDPSRGAFTFIPGPIFCNVLLVDELNRTPPRSQSAFLEAMDEGAVTVDGIRRPLPAPFLLIATQNPLEQHGTYPLPEGQLDRFALTLRLGRNSLETERKVLRSQLNGSPLDELSALLSPAQFDQLRADVQRVHVAGPLIDYVLTIIDGTRRSPEVAIGASTRAAISLVRCVQARALLCGRDHGIPDDVRALAPAALGHRVAMLDGAGGGSLARGAQAVAGVIASAPMPF